MLSEEDPARSRSEPVGELVETTLRRLRQSTTRWSTMVTWLGSTETLE
jgi:hypothetical protein